MMQGFPYVWELYVSSQVLRAVSLACLLATVLTFTLLPYAPYIFSGGISAYIPSPKIRPCKFHTYLEQISSYPPDHLQVQAGRFFIFTYRLLILCSWCIADKEDTCILLTIDLALWKMSNSHTSAERSSDPFSVWFWLRFSGSVNNA